MKTSAKGRARGGGRGGRPGRGAGAPSDEASTGVASDEVIGSALGVLRSLPPRDLQAAVRVLTKYALPGVAVVPPIPKRLKRHLVTTYEQCLPFEVHDTNDATPMNFGAPGELREDFGRRLVELYDLPVERWAVAKAALEAGLRVSIAVPQRYAVNVAATAAASLAKPALGCQVHAVYDFNSERIILFHVNENEILMAQAEQEK